MLGAGAARSTHSTQVGRAGLQALLCWGRQAPRKTRSNRAAMKLETVRGVSGGTCEMTVRRITSHAMTSYGIVPHGISCRRVKTL